MEIERVTFEFLPEDHLDRLENTDLPKRTISILRNALFTRLTDFDTMTDHEMLRQPGVGFREIKAVREARARLVLPNAEPAAD